MTSIGNLIQRVKEIETLQYDSEFNRDLIDRDEVIRILEECKEWTTKN